MCSGMGIRGASVSVGISNMRNLKLARNTEIVRPDVGNRGWPGVCFVLAYVIEPLLFYSHCF